MIEEQGTLVAHDVIGARVRSGTYLDHAVSTYTLAEKAIRDGRFSAASELAGHTISEAQEAFDLFSDWTKDIPAYLRERGASEEVLTAASARISELVWEGRAPFGDAGWTRYKELVAAVGTACESAQAEQAIALLDQARQVWRDTHDRLCDAVYGWIDTTSRLLGEDEIGPLWEHLMSPMAGFYERYDTKVRPWPRSMDALILVALEGLRGHLSGPERRGDLEVEEHEDRWAIRFDPCGSGGRTMRDDPDTGTGPRIQAPYEFGVTTRPHDWAWNKTGVCLYCAHCCVLNEKMTIRRFGYPTRVVEPPVWPSARQGSKCTWYVYKSPDLVPEEVYHRTGTTKHGTPDARAQAGLGHGSSD